MELHFKVMGEGPALVILHGLFGTLDNWQSIGRKLSSHRTVYLVDQRNHGKSPHDPAMNYHLMAEDLFHLFEEEGMCLYVSRGVGVTFLPLRIGAPPEIPILTLTVNAPTESSVAADVIHREPHPDPVVEGAPRG